MSYIYFNVKPLKLSILIRGVLEAFFLCVEQERENSEHILERFINLRKIIPRFRGAADFYGSAPIIPVINSHNSF